MSTFAYRRDIDGLRAVAVLLVVFFHLDVHALAGGYVGVDVFFVISGYLITSILKRRIEAGTFSLASFYVGRLTRLYPALLATVTATFAVAALILDPYAFRSFSGTVVSTLTWVSNINFYSQAGYWDASSELKPLLHTWSLSIEEQFYLLWPAFLLVTLRYGRRYFGTVLVVSAIMSFAAVEVAGGTNPAAAFYLLPFRIFEFALGGLASEYEQRRVVQRFLSDKTRRALISSGGLVAVIVAAATYGPTTPFPGWWALPPCAGTVAILWGASGGRSAFPVATVLASPVMVAIGQGSYAMYLVHWPIIVFYRYEVSPTLDLRSQASLLAATVVGTIVLHFGVERRFYQRGGAVLPSKPIKPVRVVGAVVASSSLLAGVAATSWLGSGWGWRYSDLALTTEAIDAGKGARFKHVMKTCNLVYVVYELGLNDTAVGDDDVDWSSYGCGMDGDVQLLFVGNSHEPDALNFFVGAFAESDLDVDLITFGTTNQCPDLERREPTQQSHGWQTTNDECQNRLDVMFDPAILDHVDAVVYGANQPYAENKQPLLRLVSDLAAGDERLLITMGGYINTSVECATLINGTGTSKSCIQPDSVTYFEGDPTELPLYGEVEAASDFIIDRTGLLCSDRRLELCMTETSNQVPFAYDKHHLSLEFSEMAGQRYVAEHPGFASQLAQGGTGHVD